jgi:hypothetical protein
MKGIAEEAFKAISDDEKDAKIETIDEKGKLKVNTLASILAKQNKKERTNRGQGAFNFDGSISENMDNFFATFNKFDELPENTPDEIAAKEKAYNNLVHGGAVQRLKTIADIQVAQFFIPKTLDKKDKFVTDAAYFRYMRGEKPIPQNILAEIIFLSNRRFFHWFLEFPKVFQRGGFDCILGNPPFLGGQKLSGSFGNPFLEYVKYTHNPIGAVDLVTYFFRRIFDLLNVNGFQSLISTNTIAQGSAREGGLDVICSNEGVINHAVRSMRWPGVAAVEVALVTIHKGSWSKDIILDTKKVDRITSYLDDSEVIGNPFPLKANAGKSFQGSIVLGKGFVVTPEQAKALIYKDKRNKDVLFPYLNGDDLNNDPEQKPSRWVINFFNWPEDKARTYPNCFEIVEHLVKPERMEQNDKGGKEQWWRFLRPRKELYETISKLDQVMVINRYTKYLMFDFQSNNTVFSDSIIAFALESSDYFTILSSSIHEIWAWKNSSTMGSSTLRYSPTNAFETFPFPMKLSKHLENLGESLNILRKKLTSNYQIGLTELQNLYHNSQINDNDDISKLRNLCCEIDFVVLKVYNWDDIELNHDFYEMEYLPENDRIRFTIQPIARKEILKRLLLLNHDRYKVETELNSTPKKKNKTKKSSESINLFTNL